MGMQWTMMSITHFGEHGVLLLHTLLYLLNQLVVDRTKGRVVLLHALLLIPEYTIHQLHVPNV